MADGTEVEQENAAVVTKGEDESHEKTTDAPNAFDKVKADDRNQGTTSKVGPSETPALDVLLTNAHRRTKARSMTPTLASLPMRLKRTRSVSRPSRPTFSKKESSISSLVDAWASPSLRVCRSSSAASS